MSSTDARVEHYLKQIMNNPDKYIFIKKKKGMSSKKAIDNERTIVIIELEKILNYMGINYSVRGYKIQYISEGLVYPKYGWIG